MNLLRKKNRAPNRIQPLPYEDGWIAEVYDRKGTLLHTTEIQKTRDDAIAAGKLWWQQMKSGMSEFKSSDRLREEERDEDERNS